MPGKIKYTKEDKMEAAMVFVTTGNVSATSRITGIPRSTVTKWIQTKNADWMSVMSEAQDVYETNLRGKLNRALTKLYNHVMANYKDMTPTQAVAAFSSLFDRQRILEGKPTRIVENSTSEEKLKRMAETLSKHAGTPTDKQYVKLPVKKEETKEKVH